jgi:DNA invertase Pin-like site-specific DNA recombinase
MVPVAAYVRVSRVAGREGDSFISPDVQRESIESLARHEGPEVVRWFRGAGQERRRRFATALERGHRDGRVGCLPRVAVWNLARFSRSIADGQ